MNLKGILIVSVKGGPIKHPAIHYALFYNINIEWKGKFL